MPTEFRGSYSVIVTPFSEDGSQIDVEALRGFLDWQLESGVPGVIVLGTTGEFLTVSDEERTQLVEATVRHVDGRMSVLVGTMNASTPNAVRYSREAEELGADGLMIVPPYYYTPTEDEIFGYYRAVAEAVSIPIMLYNNPVTSNVDMSAKLVGRLTNAFENVRYIKEASMDVARVYDIVEETGGTMNTLKSPISRAKLSSCVTTTIVIPDSASSRMTASTSPTSSGSRAEVGSSKSITFGSRLRARAIATRCCCPPESSAGNWPAQRSSPT